MLRLPTVRANILVILRDNKPDILLAKYIEVARWVEAEGQETFNEVREELAWLWTEEIDYLSKIPTQGADVRSAALVAGRIGQEQYRRFVFADEGQEF